MDVTANVYHSQFDTNKELTGYASNDDKRHHDHPNHTMINIPEQAGEHRKNELQVVHWGEIIETAALLFAWYISSSLANNLNKTILNAVPLPLTLTFVQFGFSVIFTLLLFRTSHTIKLQPLNKHILTSVVIPLCISQILAQWFTQMSLKSVPVSFTHTVKSCSPIFAILLSLYYRLKEQYSCTLIFSIVPIIAGVALSSLTEINFKLSGFITALGSTVVFSWQNVFSKKVFTSKELDHINLLLYTSLCAFVFLVPIWFVTEFGQLYFALSTDYSIGTWNIFLLFLSNGFCHFAQNVTAFTFMSKVTPLTYTVFNTAKRLFIIVTAILYFGNSVSFLNALGISMALCGVALYNKAKLDLKNVQK